MKKFTFYSLILFVLGTGVANAQWLQKAPMLSPRDCSVGWKIGNKFYVAGGTFKSDLMEYDIAANHWTQKSPIPQGVTAFAMGFVINGKGYMCGGATAVGGSFYNSLYEYDPATNTWTAKASFPATVKIAGGFGFAIGTKGYVGCGYDGNNLLSGVYEYDAVNDTWSQKGSHPAGGRNFPYCFTIGSRVFVGGGNGTQAESNDLWEYDQSTDSWAARAPLPGAARQGAVAFGSQTKGYVGLGQTAFTTLFNDVYEYDPANDVWDTLDVFTPPARAWPVGFASGNDIYVCGGWNFNTFYSNVYTLALATDTVSDVGIQGNASAAKAVSYYPNPASTELNVSMSSAFNNRFIEIYNNLGELVEKKEAGQLNNKLDLISMPKGIYFVNVKENNMIISRTKLLKQ